MKVAVKFVIMEIAAYVDPADLAVPPAAVSAAHVCTQYLMAFSLVRL
jgi:hypothetical protein